MFFWVVFLSFQLKFLFPLSSLCATVCVENLPLVQSAGAKIVLLYLHTCAEFSIFRDVRPQFKIYPLGWGCYTPHSVSVAPAGSAALYL